MSLVDSNNCFCSLLLSFLAFGTSSAGTFFVSDEFELHTRTPAQSMQIDKLTKKKKEKKNDRLILTMKNVTEFQSLSVSLSTLEHTPMDSLMCVMHLVLHNMFAQFLAAVLAQQFLIGPIEFCDRLDPIRIESHSHGHH